MKTIEAESYYGIFYFSSQRTASEFFGTAATNIWYYLNNPDKAYRGWKFRYVEGDDVIGIYIDPNRVGMTLEKWEAEQKISRKNLMRAALDPEYAKQYIEEE